MVQHEKIAIRRKDDDEFLGYLVQEGESWLAQTIFGYTMARVETRSRAEAIIKNEGLSYLTGTWQYFDKDAKQWTKHTGVDILKIPTDQATRILASVAFASLIQVFVLALVLNTIDVANAMEGLIAGLVLWLGLVTATTVGVTLYQRLKWGFLWLNAAYFLVVMGIGSVILAVWR